MSEALKDANGREIQIGDKVRRSVDYDFPNVFHPNGSKVTGFIGCAVQTSGGGVYVGRTLEVIGDPVSDEPLQ